MSDHADTIRFVLRNRWAMKKPREQALAHLDALVAENRQLRDALTEIAATDGEEWFARSVARAALDDTP